MKKQRTYILISLTSIALLVVLIIQVNWIFRTAKIKEELFNERANLVLARTTEILSLDTEVCRNLDSSMGKSDIRKIDSLFNHYMNFYNIHIDYHFEVIKPQKMQFNYGSGFKTNVFNKRLDEVVSKNGLELKLIFPDKKQYLVAEMGTLFTTSVILIIVVLVVFWYTILSLIKEQKLAHYFTEFLNNMTHEFKTPLTNIALAGKMISRNSEFKNNEKLKQYTEIILQENEKLRMQVEQVLNMTALERGEVPLVKSSVDIHQVIRDAVKSMNMQVENCHGNVILNLDAEVTNVVGDKIHLANAFCNLIDNALKYSITIPEVVISSKNRAGKILVTVSDNGMGIEKEYQSKIFDKYFRVPSGNRHDVKGFGLGLAYVKNIIESHEGIVDIYSEPNHGTTFNITFPIG